MEKQEAVIRRRAILESIDPRHSWLGYLIAAGIALAVGLALLDPSASRGAGFAGRLVFWSVHVALSLAVLECVQLLMGRWQRQSVLPPLGQVALSGMIGAVVFVPLALLLERVVQVPGIEIEADDLTLASMAEELSLSGGSVLLFWILLNTPRLLVIAAQDGTERNGGATSVSIDAEPHTSAIAAPEGDTRPHPALVELLSRLPRNLGRDIVAMTAELHYLRVYTQKGNALILMSFGRAVDGLSIVPGQRIHRSHWVAFAHVVTIETRADAIVCVLDTGLVLPVSRTFRASFRASLATRERSLIEQTARVLATEDAPELRSQGTALTTRR